MIEAYMDESGIHDGAHVCVVAGYWGSVKKWKKFEARWRTVLAHANEPTLKEFHSTEFWSADGKRRGIFANWSDTKADAFIADLARCIVDSRLFPTSAILVADDYKKLNKDERIFLTGGLLHNKTNQWITTGAPNRLYFLPFRIAVEYPAIHCSPGLHVHYVFDLNKQFRTYALELYSIIKIDPKVSARHRLGAIDFEASDKALGLQAADMLAYQSYKFGKLRIDSKRPFKRKEMPPLLRKLISNMREASDFPFIDAEGLNMMLHNMPVHMRSPGWTPVPVLSRGV